MKHVQINKTEETVQQETSEINNTKTINRAEEDTVYGHSIAWAEAIANGDRPKSGNEMVEHVPTYTLENGNEQELENLIDKLIRAKIGDPSLVTPPREIIIGNSITYFDMKVMQRVGTETGFVEKTFATINNTNKERQEDIDFSKVVNDKSNE